MRDSSESRGPVSRADLAILGPMQLLLPKSFQIPPPVSRLLPPALPHPPSLRLLTLRHCSRSSRAAAFAKLLEPRAASRARDDISSKYFTNAAMAVRCVASRSTASHRTTKDEGCCPIA